VQLATLCSDGILGTRKQGGVESVPDWSRVLREIRDSVTAAASGAVVTPNRLLNRTQSEFFRCAHSGCDDILLHVQHDRVLLSRIPRGYYHILHWSGVGLDFLRGEDAQG
jgi:hypothetical protein